MSHDEFVAAWRAGKIEVAVDPVAAGAVVSERLLLPFVAMAVIGIGIALVLWGWLWSGLTVGAIGIVGPRLIKRGATGFLLAQIADDASLYRHAHARGALLIREVGRASGPS